MDEAFKNKLYELIAINAYLAWKNTLCAHPAPFQDFYANSIKDVGIGDLVLEINNWSEPAINRIGYLKEIVSIDSLDNNTFNDMYIIETLEGKLMKWHNSDFIIIPEDRFNHKGNRNYEATS